MYRIIEKNIFCPADYKEALQKYEEDRPKSGKMQLQRKLLFLAVSTLILSLREGVKKLDFLGDNI